MDVGDSALTDPSNNDLSDNPDKFIGMDQLEWDSNSLAQPPKVQKPLLPHHQPVRRMALASGGWQALSGKHLGLPGPEAAVIILPPLVAAVASLATSASAFPAAFASVSSTLLLFFFKKKAK